MPDFRLMIKFLSRPESNAAVGSCASARLPYLIGSWVLASTRYLPTINIYYEWINSNPTLLLLKSESLKHQT